MTDESTPKFPDIDTYPNLGPPEVLPEGFKQVKFLPGQTNPPPKIKWGNKFQKGHKEEKPLQWQLDRVKKVACAMNHAADHAQTLLREMIEIANHQETQLESLKKSFEDQRQTMINMTLKHNEKQQQRIHEIQELKSELRDLKTKLNDDKS